VENLRSTLKEIVDSEGVKKIKLLATKNPVPTSLEGIAILVGELASIGKGKMELFFVKGEHNHFLHWEAPDCFERVFYGRKMELISFGTLLRTRQARNKTWHLPHMRYKFKTRATTST